MQSARRESGDHKGRELGRARRAGRCVSCGWHSDLQWRSSLYFAVVSSAYFFSRRCTLSRPPDRPRFGGPVSAKSRGMDLRVIGSSVEMQTSAAAVIVSRAHSDRGKQARH